MTLRPMDRRGMQGQAMHKQSKILIALVALLAAGCATLPRDGDVVFVKVTHVFDASEYRDATSNKAAFRGFFGERYLSMLEAAIDAGVTAEQVQHGRLVAGECSCGPECYTSYPVLLPGNDATRIHDLLEIRAGKNTWLRDGQRYAYTLATFVRSPRIPMHRWTRIEGNHSHLPACDPERWTAPAKAGAGTPPRR